MGIDQYFNIIKAFDNDNIVMDAFRGNKKGEMADVRVLAGGVFNIVHPGHVRFLKKAK